AGVDSAGDVVGTSGGHAEYHAHRQGRRDETCDARANASSARLETDSPHPRTVHDRSRGGSSLGKSRPIVKAAWPPARRGVEGGIVKGGKPPRFPPEGNGPNWTALKLLGSAEGAAQARPTTAVKIASQFSQNARLAGA